MGSCQCINSIGAKKKLLQYKYSINHSEVQIKTNNEQDHQLKFDVRIFNIRAKGLAEDKYYILKVTFLDKVFYLNPVQGPEPKFAMDETFFIKIEFSLLKTNYCQIDLYRVPSLVMINRKPTIEQALQGAYPISILLVDLLTIALGTQHHDIHLRSSVNGSILGRLRFDIICQQIEDISFTIHSLNVKLNYCVQNQISIRLKYLYERNVNETTFTQPIHSQHNTKENTTQYSWLAEKQNPLKFNKVMLSVNELQCSNLEIVFYEANYAANHEEKKSKDTKGNDDVMSEDTFFKKIPKNTTIEKYDYGSKTLVAKKQIIENIDLILLPNYKEVGYSRINFLQIVTEKDSLMQKQTSQFFYRFSYLYGQDNDTIHHARLDSDFNTQIDITQSNSNNWNNTNNKAANSKGISTANNPSSMGEASVAERDKDKGSQEEKNKQSHVVVLKLFDEKSITSFKEDILHNGKVIGVAEGRISLEHIPLLEQIMCGVHTEKGLDLNTNYNYIPLSSLQTELPRELVLLANQTLLLTQSILNFTLKQNTLSYKELNQQLTKVLQDCITPLQYKDKEGNFKFQIKTELDNIEATQILLNLGVNIINALDFFNCEQRRISYQILHLINERDELSLKTLSLLTYLDSKNEHNNKLKAKVIESFIDFMMKLLDNVLEKLNAKVSDSPTKEFIFYFIAVFYFRLPAFQKAFLKILDPSYELYKCTTIKNYNYIFDWGELFYYRLAKIPEVNFEAKREEMKKVLEKTNWRDRISCQGIGFFSIIQGLDMYLSSRYGKNQEVNLDSVTGITEIKKTIVSILEKKEIITFSQGLINVLAIFLYNHNDMNTFYKIIISKTNAYDSPSVFMAIKILDSFFEAYEQNKNQSAFSYKFDYNLVKCPFKIILEIDNSLCIAKYLWLYYKNTHLMSITHVNEMLIDLFQNNFFRLFFHWAWQVRDIFYHFLWYIISHRLKNKNYSEEKKNLFEERMNTLRRGDEKGFYKAFHNDYYEQMKSSILKEYYENVRIIEVIRSIVRKEKLDPYFKSAFTGDSKLIEKIGIESTKYVVTAIQQYDGVEKEYKLWEKQNRNKKDVVYPEIQMLPPRDDYTEYTSSCADQW